MGKAAKLEFLRRLLPLCLAVLGTVGGFTFLTPITGLICWLAGLGIYAALPLPKLPSGAVSPEPVLPVYVTDAFAFLISVGCLSLMAIGLYSGTGAAQATSFLLIAPACLAIPFFLMSVRQRTSWVRFFGNGFEFADLGLRVRVKYEDIRKAGFRDWRAKTGFAAYFAALGSSSKTKVSLLSSSNETLALVLTRFDGTEFMISTELIPDLKKVLIGMDRAGVELPESLSEKERQKIRKKRERMYGRDDAPLGPILPDQKQVARIAALIDHARRRKA